MKAPGEKESIDNKKSGGSRAGRQSPKEGDQQQRWCADQVKMTAITIKGYLYYWTDS